MKASQSIRSVDKELSVLGLTNVASGGVLTVTTSSFATAGLDLRGGTLTAPTLVDFGSVNFSSGTLNVTAAPGVTIGPGSAFGESLTLDSSNTLSVTYTTTIAANGTLTVDGATVTTGPLINNGTFNFSSGTLTVKAALQVESGALLGGTVVIDGSKTLQPDYLNVGRTSDGSLSIIDGGRVNVADQFTSGTNEGAHSTVVVRGFGSKNDVGCDFRCGRKGHWLAQHQ